MAVLTYLERLRVAHRALQLAEPAQEREDGPIDTLGPSGREVRTVRLFAATLTHTTVTPLVAAFLLLLRDVTVGLTPRWLSG